MIVDVLNAYAKEHVPLKRSAVNIIYTIESLKTWWREKKISDVTSKNCRAYAGTKPPVAARRDLETLRAAMNYWHREYGPLAFIPGVTLPPKPEPRERWLSRKEARALRHAAKGTQHLYRFIVIALLTGSRSRAIFDLQWDWIDFESMTMRRRAPGTKENPQKRTPPVRMGQALARILRRWKGQDAALDCPYVVHYHGQPVSRIKRSWAGACKTAKLKDVSPHTLRHTRAAWMMLEGVNLWEAAGSLGMTPTVLQSIYGKHDPNYQKNAAEV